MTVEDAATADYSGLDIVLFSAGKGTSRELAPRVAEAGAVVIDNSSALRMDPQVPLVVAEVNPHAAADRPKGIIANPNCTTMAAMPVLRPLHAEAGLVGLVVATYQAVSGAGLAGVAELDEQVRKVAEHAAELAFDGAAVEFPAPALVRPADRVQRAPAGRLDRRRRLASRPTRSRSCATRAARSSRSPTCRSPAPASGCRSSPATRCRSTPGSPGRSPRSAPASCWPPRPGVALADVPTPLQAAGQDPTYVGRIRADETVEHGLALFCSNDNLRKGAALNAVQIAELVAAERR